MLTKHPESHLDHVPPVVIDFVLERFKDKEAFFLETFTLPEGLPTLENALYGPKAGDAPVAESEVFYAARPGRGHVSRLVDRPTRQTRQVTVIAGPSAKGAVDCVIYTVFGGPGSPRELADPTLPEDERQSAADFWAEHALARP